MLNFLKKDYLFFFFLAVFTFFISPFLLKGLLPIPSDSLVGLYHPFRDFYAKDYSRGVPFKNFLITDPVRQIYPWKELSIDNLSKMTLPIWNPYEMAGTPLLGNFQSSPFYPLNIIFLLKPFYFSWSLFIVAQMLLGGIFMHFYLRSLKLHRAASVLGATSWVFCGVFVAWLEWGNILHTVLWLPLILLSIDKIVTKKTKGISVWFLVLLFSLISSFFAGHLQLFFYIFIFSAVYLCMRVYQTKNRKALLPLALILFIFFLITSIQWVPGLQFINQSGRNVDSLLQWTKEGWFMPWQNLIQFLAPDFFGNPATLNYWGAWNYAEFIGYVGLLPLLFASLAILTRRDKKTSFFTVSLGTLLLFILPTPVAKIPYQLMIPFISTAQPTRLMFLVCFCLVVLAAMGFDYFLRTENTQRKMIKKNSITVFSLVSLVFFCLIVFVIFGNFSSEYLAIAKRNLIFPAIIFGSYIFLFVLFEISKNKRLRYVILALAFLLFALDVVRFNSKFNPFTSKEYLFPITKSIEFLQKDKSIFRIASTDLRILPPNFPTHYRIQTIEGYDPLYLLTYAEFITVLERGKPDITLPFGFNRIITPHNIESKLIDFLNVKYFLSLTDLKNEKLTKVFQEGETRIYENKAFYPRVYFVNNVVQKTQKQDVLASLFSSDLRFMAVTEEPPPQNFGNLTVGNAKIVSYTENKVIIQTENSGPGFLVFSDTYYPSWKVSIDGKIDRIYKTNHAFRGIYISTGAHTVTFYTTLF